MDFHELLAAPTSFIAPAQALDGLTDEDAGRRLAPGVHNIGEIAAHMVFWQAWFLDRCQGVATPVPAAAAEGWPAFEAGSWDIVRDRLLQGIDQAVAFGRDRTRLPRAVTPAIEFPPFANLTIEDALVHIAVHNAHHLGQIITLRQLAGRWPGPGGSYTW